MPKSLIDGFTLLLKDKEADPALVAAAISMPAASELMNVIDAVDPVTLHEVRCAFG